MFTERVPAVCIMLELSTVTPAPFAPIVIGQIVAPVVISGFIARAVPPPPTKPPVLETLLVAILVAVIALFAIVKTPALLIVASPLMATAVATLDPFPTKILADVSVDVSLLLNVVQSPLER